MPGLIIGPLSDGSKVPWKETTGAGEQIAPLRSTLEARRMYIHPPMAPYDVEPEKLTLFVELLFSILDYPKSILPLYF